MSSAAAHRQIRNHRPCTQFAAGLNPWSPQEMSTASPSANHPFPRTPKQPHGPRIAIDKLKIEKNVALPVTRSVAGRYDGFFSKLEAKDSIPCKPDEAAPIATALRKFLRDRKLGETLTVVATTRFVPEGAGIKLDQQQGRVWLWPKDEPHPNAQQVAGGKARAANRKKGRP